MQCTCTRVFTAMSLKLTRFIRDKKIFLTLKVCNVHVQGCLQITVKSLKLTSFIRDKIFLTPKMRNVQAWVFTAKSLKYAVKVKRHRPSVVVDPRNVVHAL